jgi:tetratricopeptide (TPR) repeat protein
VSGPLFQRYKAALRRGHLAALADSLDDALDAYREAARLAPDRALPFASQGTVLHRLDRWPQAAEAFEQALRVAPDDEATLRARGGAREERGLRSGAASDFERLAFVLDVAGRAAEAADAARRALELEKSPARTALLDRLTTSAARASDPGTARETAPDGTTWPAIDLPSPSLPRIVGPPPDHETLMANATNLLDAGDTSAARDLMLMAVLIHRNAGRLDAALDVCLQLLAFTPGDAHVHLAIANLQLDHGWTTLATEKIELLRRLTALTGDMQAAADVQGLAAERLRDEPVPATATR